MGMISVTGPTKIDVADAAKYYPIPCPSNATIKRLRITNAGAGWKARFYSRKFTTLPIQIALLDKAGTRVQVHTAVRHEFKVGDHVEWNSEAGRVRGTIKKKVTSALKFKTYTVRASKEEPQYLIKSDKTDHFSMHKGAALKTIRETRKQ